MKTPPSWLFLAVAIPCLVLTCLALAYESSLKTTVGAFALLGPCAGWYFTLRGEERFESQPHYRDLRNNLLSSLPVGSDPQLSRPELPPDLCWSAPREHFGLTKYGFGKFRRTTFWCTAASGHFRGLPTTKFAR